MQEVYTLTTDGKGCIVDVGSQISSSEQPLIAVSVMKISYTNVLLKMNNRFAISVISKNVDSNIIETFNLNFMRNVNKLKQFL